MKENTTQVLHLLKNLPGKANMLFFTGKSLVQSLTCSGLKFPSITGVSNTQLEKEIMSLDLMGVDVISPYHNLPLVTEYTLKHIP
ncbi:hypothetical protein DSO57_1036968 [Entomophthora muscae]|uniref:Uncharacterized protein n=1 Tax=Entomophthora muscae TaxID=34485 RepID=A0ACC2SZ68_9FUNG|nr:hypothetical protein DSO57_1036968 [Entomophthora muscae]